MNRSAPHFQLGNRRQFASSATPHGLGEEFPSPIPAVESSGRIHTHPSLPAQTIRLGLSSLPAPASPAEETTALLYSALPPGSRLYSPSPWSPACKSAKSQLGGRCPARGESSSRPGGATSTGISSDSAPVEGTSVAKTLRHFSTTIRAVTSFRVCSSRSVIEGVTSPVHRFSPQGLSRR